MPQNSNDGSDKPPSIAKVVGKHADQVMDGLFSEIEELLSGDLQEKQQPARLTANAQQQPPAHNNIPPGNSAGRKTRSADGSESVPPPQTQTPPNTPLLEPTPPAQRRWPKRLAIGGTLLLVTGGLLGWLQSQGKINLAALAKGESPVLLSNSADVQFSDYLRRSVTKIDSNTAASGGTQIAIPNPPTATTNTPSSLAAATINATLTKIVPGNPPVVEFTIDGRTQQFKGGDQVANSGWIVTNVINTVDNEVILKRNGESRSLKINDKL
jgi:hypothetical protein